MKRYGPFNQPDTAPWVNGNPATGQRGSIPNALAIDHAQTEIVNAIKRLGLVPDAANLEQLGIAIQNAISAATGGGDVEQFVTFPSARARLPIYPEVDTSDGRLSVITPSAGSIFVLATGNILHRGIYAIAVSDIAEIDRTFATLASKTYHLRWRPATGFSLIDLADVGYNPLGLGDISVEFDSSFDDMLVASVTTNSSNVATVVSLANKVRYNSQSDIVLNMTGARSDNAIGVGEITYNLARAPIVVPHFRLINVGGNGSGDAFLASQTHDHDQQLHVSASSRYAATIQADRDYAISITVRAQVLLF